MPVRALKSCDVCERRRHGRTKLWEDIKRQVLTPPIKRGPRENIWPEDEIDAIIRAEFRGASVEERKALCKRLVEARKSA
jgi:predicted DNA-binding transcriptional regulator AlpA